VSEGRSRRRSKDSGAVVYVTLRLKTGRVSYNIGALWWCARLCARTLCCACPLQLPPPPHGILVDGGVTVTRANCAAETPSLHQVLQLRLD
jgi:hypothetical protein